VSTGEFSLGPRARQDDLEAEQATTGRKVKILVGACGSLNIINLHNYLINFANVYSQINVILTKSALNMVQPVPIQAITGNPIYTDGSTNGLPVPHNNLALWPSLFLILPATANILAKSAHGIADDLLSTVIIAHGPPILFVPSMSQRMWQSPAVRRNVETLQGDGHMVIRRVELRETLEVGNRETVASELMPSVAELMSILDDHLRAV
jgi:phosphopantothenoylcysteine decarboxylase/phosphopantothenate--cysteine ligase